MSNLASIRLAFHTVAVTLVEDLHSELTTTPISVVCWTDYTGNKSPVSSGIASGGADPGPKIFCPIPGDL